MKFRNKKKKKQTREINLGTTLYDMNKNLIEQKIKDLTPEQMQNKKDLIINFINQTNNYYYMLLCNERKDYTIFHRNSTNNEAPFINNCVDFNQDKIEEVLINECLPNRGNTKSIELTENNDAIEIWISIDNESYCYYFFPYDEAIIEC